MKHWRGGLLLAVVGVLLIWAWLTATDGVQRPAPMADAMASTSATEPDETQSAPAPATGAERSPTSVPPRAGDSADAGDLPSPQHLVALGAVLADTPPNALPPVGQRLAQARAADEAAHQAKAVRERQADSARESARARAAAEYIDRVRAKIRGNIVLPADVRGNPEAVFEVSQLPNGEVLPPLRLKRSSGHAGLDLAIERAILKSSPLPRPPSPELFSRVLELRFRPLEDGEGR